jgi:opacity protein-like surface antigen
MRMPSRRLHILVLAAALVSGSAVTARAQAFISPYAGYNFGGDSANCISLQNCEEKRLNLGVSFGTTHGILGFEEDIGYARDFFGKTPGSSNSVLTVMSNLLIVVPAGPIQPYALVGLGLIRPHAQFDATSLALDKNAFGYDIGGGINIFLAHAIGVRGDVRHLHTLQNVSLGIFSSDQLDFWRASAGLTLRF